MVERLRAAFDRLLERLRPEGPCLRCHGTGVWRSRDCPDCGGKVSTKDGAPFRYRKPGFRNPEFIATGA